MNRIPVSSFNNKKSKVNVKNPRCLELFLNCCKSKATRETYANHLTAFLKHVEKDHESFLMLSNVERNIILEDYAMFCKSSGRYSASSIRGIFSAIDKFLFVNDKTMNKKKLMMFLPEEKKTSQRAITTEENRLLLAVSSDTRSKAIVHLFNATDEGKMIGFVGLYEPSCFQMVEIDEHDPDPQIPFYQINEKTQEVEELFIHSFEEKLTIRLASADISYRKYELASAKYPVLRVNHITKWF